MSCDYKGFLISEGLPPYFQIGSSIDQWDTFLEGEVLLGGTESPLTWGQFLQRIPGVELLPRFVESEVAVLYDKALCGFGTGRQGLVLQNKDLEGLFLPAVRGRTDRTAQMVALAGWWSIYFPWDLEAFLHYRPVELVWFLLKHINSPPRVAQPTPLSPLRFSIASLAMLPWADLIAWCDEFGILDEYPHEGGVIRGFHWMAEPTSVTERYNALRKVRSACYASVAFPCMPLFAKWFGRGTFEISLTGADNYGSPGYLCDDDLRVLLECSVGITLDTAAAAATLMGVRALGGRNLFFVDVAQWQKALGGEESAALIPVICQLFYNYQVSVTVSGMAVAMLYEELRLAIRRQSFPSCIFPLTWTFSTIVSAFNAHPEFNSLYDFEVAVRHGSLNHGRRVLLSIMFIGASEETVVMQNWYDAYTSVLFPPGAGVMNCAGRNAEQCVLTCKAGFVLGECSSQDRVTLLLTCFSEEDQEAIVSEDMLPQRVRDGIAHRLSTQASVDACLAAMLQDERTLLGRRAAGMIDLEGTSLPVLSGVVKYQFLGGSYQATGEVPLGDANTVPAFTWVFAIREVLLTMSGSAGQRDQQSRWRLYVYPPRQVVLPVRATSSSVFPGPGVRSTSTVPMVGPRLEVDLDAIASSGFAVSVGLDLVATLQPLFMRRQRCVGLNDPVPPGAPPQAVGLSKLLCWGELPIVVQGDSVVLPFATAEKAEGIHAWLASGEGVFTWEYLLTVMSIGLFHVDIIRNNSYVVSFQTRLAGQVPVEEDPMTRLLGVNVDLDCPVGLQLTEAARANSKGWLGVDVQRCIVPLLQSSPMKMKRQESAPTPRSGVKRVHVEFDDDLEEGEETVVMSQPNRLLDSAGNSVYVNKHQALIHGFNQSLLLRTVTSKDRRRSMFPEAFTMGSGEESPAVYLDPGYIFRQAEARKRQGSHSVGMGEALVSKGKLYWGKFTDKEFLLKISLFLVENFDSSAVKKICMEHYSKSANPTPISDCSELVVCLLGLFQTYDELWDLNWKKELGPTYVEFLEQYEEDHSVRLDWHYASRVVLYFFYHLQEAARLPRTGLVMMGQDAPLVRAERIKEPEDWVPFMLEAFIPFCSHYFSGDQTWGWSTKKLALPPQQFYSVGSKDRTMKKSGGSTGGGGSSSSSSSSGTGVQVESGVNSPKLRFCVRDAFQFVGIPEGTLDGTKVKKCGGASCQYTHVSSGSSRMYSHKDVFAGVFQAINRAEAPVKKAWLDAMSEAGGGEKLFKKPYANKA